LLATAQQSGHAVGLHGLEHGRFDLGIPPKMVLDLPHEGPAREYLAAHRQKIEASLQVENIRCKLRKGRAILADLAGCEADGFRAPCLAVCDNLFTALEAEGFAYDSSKCLQPGAWDLINGRQRPEIAPINREIFDAMQTPGRMRTFPLTAEYTWYLSREKYRAFVELAKSDFDACLEAGIPFVPLCHVSPVQEGEADCGFDLHRELIAHARQASDRRGMKLVCTTLSDMVRTWVRQ